MTDDIRMSGPTLRVLKLMLERPKRGQSGAEISRATGIGSGTMYPLLARLESIGWLSSTWEAIDPAQAGRPRKRFYILTGQGQANAARALSQLQVAPEVLSWA